MNFDHFFKAATGYIPFPYQRRLASQNGSEGARPCESSLIHVPTGLGKTAGAILGWLWNYLFQRTGGAPNWPRRLVYCLPMRVLVEQTEKNVIDWLGRLKAGATLSPANWGQIINELTWLVDHSPVVLIGGEELNKNKRDWDIYPEKPAILVGTQDMLLSRVLNRGYGMSRYRWPMHFGLLNNDCLWIMDEVQLMGAGLATGAQLEAFRRQLSQLNANAGCTRTFWMSATLQRDWLKTVDFDPSSLPPIALDGSDYADLEVGKVWNARKPLERANAPANDQSGLAKEIVGRHRSVGSRTLVVVNTVKRARGLFKAIDAEMKRTPSSQPRPDLILIHSRFRPDDRRAQVDRLCANPSEQGMIVVSTQVVEAGIDVSAVSLFTELAPWASLVQRFGRCNRKGAENQNAGVFWIDLPADLSAPYEADALVEARQRLSSSLQDVGPASLPNVSLPHKRGSVLRRKDLVELFDTTQDMAGNDIDVEPYVREAEECDVQVFWRDWPAEREPGDDMPAAACNELCSVSVSEFRDFVKKEKGKDKLTYRWEPLDRKWTNVDPSRIFAGQLYLVHVSTGGYRVDTGWDAESANPVNALVAPQATPDANDADGLSQTSWQSIAEHTEKVSGELGTIILAMPHMVPACDAQALRLAARWHDRGKAHPVFQKAIRSQSSTGQARPAPWNTVSDIAKAPSGWWQRYERNHFRHELASALSVLMTADQQTPQTILDLVAFLVAAHHGKVRLSIRSLPGEAVPPRAAGQPERRFARGIWEEDLLPETDLGGHIKAPEVTLSLEPMELGLCAMPPFAGSPGWLERMIDLREKLGPFRLAYLEAILRAADARAS